MPLEIPNLDNRRWADLVEEARALIPRVAPRWTDHNVHDPGMTFIELFAWLAEMQLYQLNRVAGNIAKCLLDLQVEIAACANLLAFACVSTAT
jgi:hypothetical protein